MAETKLKVVQILPALESGGVERGTLEVAEALVRAGHESIVISAGGRLVESLQASGSRHLQWNLGAKSPMTLLQIPRLRRWLKSEAPDILHLRSRMPAWIAWLAWRGLPQASRPRLVTTVHGLYSVSGYSAVMCRGERVIAVSETARRYILDNYPATAEADVRRIYRGVDPEEFPWQYQPDPAWLEAWYAQYPMLRSRKVLVLPGRLTRLKGHHHFIDLVQQLKARGRDVIGLVVGGEDPKRGAYARELYRRVEQLGLSGELIFTGHRQDMREIYASATLIFSLSTKQESFGRTVLEALSMGKPVVGYDHGGVGEILAALYPQGRVPVNDTERLLATVERFLETDSEPEQNRLFLKQRMLQETLDLYRELVR